MDLQRSTRRRTAGAVAAACATGYLALAVLVVRHPVNRADLALRDLARPDLDWGPRQERWDVLQNALRPTVVAALLALVTLVVVVRRRTLVPAVTGVLAVALSAGGVLASKELVARPDPYIPGVPSGAFPSGHTYAVVVCLGLALLIARPRSGVRALSLPLVAGVLMGVSLLVQGVHWTSDVVGSLLWGTAWLAAWRALPPHWTGSPAHDATPLTSP